MLTVEGCEKHPLLWPEDWRLEHVLPLWIGYCREHGRRSMHLVCNDWQAVLLRHGPRMLDVRSRNCRMYGFGT